MERVFLIDGLRSHVGIRGGIFRSVLPEQLGASVLKALGKRQDLSLAEGLFCGNAVGPGGNIGRLTLLAAGLPASLPAVTIDMQCASSLAAVDLAYGKLASGQCQCLIAGGVESSSLAPEKRYHEKDPRSGLRERVYHAAQFIPGEFCDEAMLLGAERTAGKAGISREEADRAALASQRRAAAAEEAGIFKNDIVPLFGSTRDEAIRPRLNEKIMRRAPVMSGVPCGIVTAANACTINDGAAFLLLATETFARDHHLEPRAEIVMTAMTGGDPECPPFAADEAAAAVLGKMGLAYSDVTTFEYNEAFSVIDVLFERNHPEVKDRLNPYGGALAYGHPYGASGAIILLHLLASLEEKGGYGVASIGAAGGVGEAVLLRRN